MYYAATTVEHWAMQVSVRPTIEDGRMPRIADRLPHWLRHSHGKSRELASGPEGSLDGRSEGGITRGLLAPLMAENY